MELEVIYNLNEPEFKHIVFDIIKMQTRIHAKDQLSEAQWNELQNED